MRRLLIGLGFGLALATACGGGDSTAPGPSVAGVYTLRTMNGAPLPFVLYQSGADMYEILDDAITLNDGGTWSESGHDRTTISGTVTTSNVVEGGTYTVQGTAITLLSPTSGSITGALSSTSITLTGPGLVGVYTR
jgi:hypothetical protein